MFFFADGCATPWIHPRKNVVCYFEGKRPISTLNVCLCTHLIYTDIGLNSYGQLDISNGKTQAVDCLFPHLVLYMYVRIYYAQNALNMLEKTIAYFEAFC